MQRLQDAWKKYEADSAVKPLRGQGPVLLPETQAAVPVPPPAPTTSAPVPAVPAAPAAAPSDAFQPIPPPAPIPAFQVDTKSLERQLAATQQLTKTAEAELEVLPSQISKAYQGQLGQLQTDMMQLQEQYKDALASNLQKFEKDKLIVGIAQVAETLLYNITRFSAGIHGWQTGRDYTTGMPFNPTDWHSELAGLRSELKERQGLVDAEFGKKLGMKEKEIGTVEKTKATELQERLAAIRSRLSAGGQREWQQQQEIAQTRRENVRIKQEAAEKTAAAAQRTGEFNVAQEERRRASEEANETRRAIAEAQQAAKSAKGESDVAKAELKETERVETLLGDTTDPKKFQDARAQIILKLQSLGMSNEEINEVVRKANEAGQLLPDFGKPETQPWSAEGILVVRQALREAKARQASAPAEGMQVPTADAAAAELARRRAGKK